MSERNESFVIAAAAWRAPVVDTRTKEAVARAFAGSMFCGS